MSAIVAVLSMACTAEPSSMTAPRAESTEDPRIVCVREHPSSPAYEPVVRALCAELTTHRGVSAGVAIAVDGRVRFSTAIGPRCRGQAEPLDSTTVLGIGSITKLVTAPLAITIAERHGIDLDEPLTRALPEFTIAPTLRGLLTHTAGLRDPEPAALLAAGDAWPRVLAEHRRPSGDHVYANAGYLLVGRWLEDTTGRPFADLFAHEPGLAPVREHVALEIDASMTLGCGHARGLGWRAIEPTAVPPLPAWTLPAGGGLASVAELVQLPEALERTGRLTTMIEGRVPSDRIGWDYGLGIRVRGTGDELVLAHAGNTGTYWAELQWSPTRRVAVAVVSTTPQAFKATLHAAFTAGLAGGPQ
ncbi:MAG: serine hydrolase domain-containing protein [Myxococcota bacterium]